MAVGRGPECPRKVGSALTFDNEPSSSSQSGIQPPNTQPEPVAQPKKKRGRPPGSKNKPK